MLEQLRTRAYPAGVLVFAAGSVIEALLAGHVHPRPLVVALALAWSLPFLVRGRFPFGVPLVSCAAVAALAVWAGHSIDNASMPYLAAVAAAVSFGLLADRRDAIAGLVALAALGALIAFESKHTEELFWAILFFGLAWFFGTALGTRTRQASVLRTRVEEAERAREQAVLNERTRIARELHDVVAHSLSAMVVQASAARQGNGDGDALREIEVTGRQALAEMRRMLGVLPSEEVPAAARAPQPGLRDLGMLIAEIEKAGLPATLSIEGTPSPLPAGVDLSAYRIVQEGLAHALADPGCSRAAVVVRYGEAQMEIEITDNGPGLANFDGNGAGLIGMRERVALYGGTLHVDPCDEGGFILHAQLPVDVAR
jgi:signal transduction histidine kinase